jgi:hypothetical protein
MKKNLSLRQHFIVMNVKMATVKSLHQIDPKKYQSKVQEDLTTTKQKMEALVE